MRHGESSEAELALWPSSASWRSPSIEAIAGFFSSAHLGKRANHLCGYPTQKDLRRRRERPADEPPFGRPFVRVMARPGKNGKPVSKQKKKKKNPASSIFVPCFPQVDIFARRGVAASAAASRSPAPRKPSLWSRGASRKLLPQPHTPPQYRKVERSGPEPETGGLMVGPKIAPRVGRAPRFRKVSSLPAGNAFEAPTRWFSPAQSRSAARRPLDRRAALFPHVLGRLARASSGCIGT